MPVYQNITKKGVYITDTWKTLPGEFFYFPPQGSLRLDSLVKVGHVRMCHIETSKKDIPGWIQVEYSKFMETGPISDTKAEVIFNANDITHYLREKLPQHPVESRTYGTKFTCYFFNQVGVRIFREVILPHLEYMARTIPCGVVYTEKLFYRDPKMNLKLFMLWQSENADTVARVPWDAPDHEVYGLPTPAEYVVQLLNLEEAIKRDKERQIQDFKDRLERTSGEWKRNNETRGRR